MATKTPQRKPKEQVLDMNWTFDLRISTNRRVQVSDCEEREVEFEPKRNFNESRGDESFKAESNRTTQLVLPYCSLASESARGPTYASESSPGRQRIFR